jgi:hypothetical protein
MAQGLKTLFSEQPAEPNCQQGLDTGWFIKVTAQPSLN